MDGPHYWHTGFVVWTVSFTLICRFVGVYGLVFLANRRRIRKVNLQEQFIMAYGGLRGAVGFSLVEMIDKEVIPPKQMFVTTTLAVVMFTIFFQVTDGEVVWAGIQDAYQHHMYPIYAYFIPRVARSSFW